MNDDFLRRIRREPSPRFLASLQARLAQGAPVPEKPWRRQALFVAGVLAGAALASGIYLAREWLTPRVPALPATNASNPPPIEAPAAHGSVVADDSKTGATAESQQTVANPRAVSSGAGATPPRLDVAATIPIAPLIQAATRSMYRSMSFRAADVESSFSLMPTGAIVAALCGTDDAIQAIVTDRRILPDELAACRGNQRHLSEVKIGYEAVNVVNSNLYPRPRFTARALFLGLAREVPDPARPDVMIPNPYVTWDQIDPALPDERIDVLGPPASSTTAMVFRRTVLEAGCRSFPAIAALETSDPARFDTVCGAIRADYYRPKDSIPGSAQNPYAFVGYLQANPGALAVHAEGNLQSWNLSAAAIDDVVPAWNTIRSGAYTGSRALYLYVDKSSSLARNFAYALYSALGSGMTGYGLTDAISGLNDRAEQRAVRDQVLTLPEL